MSLSKRKLAILALISANIIWGASFPIYKWALKDIPPFTFVFLRFFLGALVVLPFTIHDLKIAREDIGKVIACSFLGITLAISFLFLGLNVSPSINAPIIFSSGPILLILFAIFYLKEKAKKKKIIGTFIGLIGVLIIVIRPLLEHGFNLAIVGNFFFILACISDNLSVLILLKIMKKYSPLTIVFWTFVIGVIPLVPLVIFEQLQHSTLNGLNSQGIIGIAYGFLLSSALGHFLFAYGAKYIQTQEIGIFSYVDPLATVLIAIPLLGEKITIYYLLGSLFVFIGIFIAEGRIHYHPFHLLKKEKN